MTKLAWDAVGERHYETGVDHGVLYQPTSEGAYESGVAWNGLTTVTESPSGAEASPFYADNMKYLNLRSAEEFGATIEAYTYPPEFNQFDGLGVPTPGVSIGQQNRGVFGFSYRTKIGNDVDGNDHAFKLHLVYGASASPSEKAYSTINDTPEPITFSWELTTIPVAVEGFKPTAIVTIDSRDVDATKLNDFLDILYGTDQNDPRMPLPDEVIEHFEGAALVEAMPTAPAFDAGTDTITIPSVTGVEYTVDGEVVPAGPLVITEDTLVVARPADGYRFPDTEAYDNDWVFDYTP
jgi:hypothetical protein